MERYLESQFYENVNSSKWRDHLRASHGFCREHAWLSVDKRLGDALRFSIIYRDILNSIATRLYAGNRPIQTPRAWVSLLGQIPEQVRTRIACMLSAIKPRKRCPACEHRDKITWDILTALV